MIFVIDVGNTNMTMGVFCGEKLAATFRIMTKTPRTSDEYGIMITQLLKSNGIKTSDIEGAIIASVVPDVMHSLTSSIIRYLHTKPIIVGFYRQSDLCKRAVQHPYCNNGPPKRRRLLLFPG